MCLIFHKWTPWSYPVKSYSANKVQYKTCTVCNLIRCRTFYDVQTDTRETDRALESITPTELSTKLNNVPTVKSIDTLGHSIPKSLIV